MLSPKRRFTITSQGVVDLFKLTAQELCVGETCVTETQFQQVFGNGSQASARGVSDTPTYSSLSTVNTYGVLEVNTLKSQRVEITNPYGLTIYDVITGQPQCVFSQEGQLRTISGKCDGIVANVQTAEQPQAQNNADTTQNNAEPTEQNNAETEVEEQPAVEDGSQASAGSLASEPQVVEVPAPSETP